MSDRDRDRKRISASLSVEATAALPDEGNVSAIVSDAIAWASRLDLTEQRVGALADMARRLSDLDAPFESACSIAEQAIADGALAYQHLRAQRWTGGEVLAALNATMGTLWMYGMPLGTAMAVEMSDAVALGSADLSTWGVTAERWIDLCDAVRRDPETARALLDVSRVIWRASGSSLERALYRGIGRQADDD